MARYTTNNSRRDWRITKISFILDCNVHFTRESRTSKIRAIKKTETNRDLVTDSTLLRFNEKLIPVAFVVGQQTKQKIQNSKYYKVFSLSLRFLQRFLGSRL